MNDPLIRLRAWVAQFDRQCDAADRIGCHESHLSRILAGQRKPGMLVAHAIERETRGLRGGRIRAAEWVAS